MSGRIRSWCALGMTLLLLLGGTMEQSLPWTAAARAEAETSGAKLSPITPKPWQVPQAATLTPIVTSTLPPASIADVDEENTALLDATGTLPPSSLNGWEEEPTATPTPLPTPTPTEDTALPGVLGLNNPSVFRMLLIGTDAYTVKQDGRSDTMILLQVDTRTRDIKMISFLRDLYVKISGHGKTRLNAAYVYGGVSLLKQTLEDNFGVTMDRTLTVNFSLMVELIDRIGGVTVDVSERERKQLNSILKFYNTHNGYKQRDQLLTESGVQHLTGKQALCYSRIRKIDSDFARTSRQRKVLEGVYQRVKELDGLTLAGILTETLSQVKTDMTLADAVALVPVLLKLNEAAFDELTIPVKNGYSSETISGMMVLVPNLNKNQDAIAEFLETDTAE